MYKLKHVENRDIRILTPEVELITNTYKNKNRPCNVECVSVTFEIPFFVTNTTYNNIKLSLLFPVPTNTDIGEF